jgi:3-oxoacyl-[acyl-carrier protein] reductase
MSERVALVTGGARGIGRAICLALADDGHAVAVNYRSRGDEAEALAAEIRAAGGRAFAVQGDVSVTADVERVVADVDLRLGPPLILVNNAALTDTHKPWTEIDEAEWREVIDVNLTSCFLTLRAVHPHMQRAGWGRIVNISSVTVHLGRENLLHYVASKAGMIGFTRTLAREVGPDGITVNAVTPGAIRTEAELEMFPDQESVAARLFALQAVKRRGVPADIGAAVAFLASEGAAFISGQTLNVDGGWAMP